MFHVGANESSVLVHGRVCAGHSVLLLLLHLRHHTFPTTAAQYVARVSQGTVQLAFGFCMLFEGHLIIKDKRRGMVQIKGHYLSSVQNGRLPYFNGLPFRIVEKRPIVCANLLLLSRC